MRVSRVAWVGDACRAVAPQTHGGPLVVLTLAFADEAVNRIAERTRQNLRGMWSYRPKGARGKTKVGGGCPFPTCHGEGDTINMGRLGRHVSDGVYGLRGVRLWNFGISFSSSPSGYRPGSRCT